MILLNDEPTCIKVKQTQSAAIRCEIFIFSLIGRLVGNGLNARSATGIAKQYIPTNDIAYSNIALAIGIFKIHGKKSWTTSTASIDTSVDIVPSKKQKIPILE